MNAVNAIDGRIHSRLLRLLRDNGALSRAELADRLEVPPAATVRSGQFGGDRADP